MNQLPMSGFTVGQDVIRNSSLRHTLVGEHDEASMTWYVMSCFPLSPALTDWKGSDL